MSAPAPMNSYPLADAAQRAELSEEAFKTLADELKIAGSKDSATGAVCYSEEEIARVAGEASNRAPRLDWAEVMARFPGSTDEQVLTIVADKSVTICNGPKGRCVRRDEFERAFPLDPTKPENPAPPTKPAEQPSAPVPTGRVWLTKEEVLARAGDLLSERLLHHYVGAGKITTTSRGDSIEYSAAAVDAVIECRRAQRAAQEAERLANEERNRRLAEEAAKAKESAKADPEATDGNSKGGKTEKMERDGCGCGCKAKNTATNGPITVNVHLANPQYPNDPPPMPSKNGDDGHHGHGGHDHNGHGGNRSNVILWIALPIVAAVLILFGILLYELFSKKDVKETSSAKNHVIRVVEPANEAKEEAKKATDKAEKAEKDVKVATDKADAAVKRVDAIEQSVKDLRETDIALAGDVDELVKANTAKAAEKPSVVPSEKAAPSSRASEEDLESLRHDLHLIERHLKNGALTVADCATRNLRRKAYYANIKAMGRTALLAEMTGFADGFDVGAILDSIGIK